MRQPRPYQSVAIAAVQKAWLDGARSVCLVAPTAAGKTVMLSDLVGQWKAPRTLWVTHRWELVTQSAEELRADGHDVGIYSAKLTENSDAPVIVASWQTLLARPSERPHADLLIIDECHHAVAPEFRSVIDHYAGLLKCGATATPSRGDGKPLGDLFDALVIAAQYSELIKEGFIVPCRVRRPAEPLGSDLAQEPLAAYLQYAPGKSCIAFCRSIDDAEKFAVALTAAGHPAMCVSARTPGPMRDHIIEAFKAGDIRVLTNDSVLTEGFNHPPTQVCLLASGCSTTGAYLQKVGRVLRACEGKTEALLLDLPGASWVHGIPTEDRVYSLDGRPISSSGALRVCVACGFTFEPAGSSACPSCGFSPPPVPIARPRIYDMALEEVWQGAATAEPYKQREWERLKQLCADRGFKPSFSVHEYKKLFGAPPPGPEVRAEMWAAIRAKAKEKAYGIAWAIRQYKILFDEPAPIGDVTYEEKMAELTRLRAIAQAKGYKPGFAAVNYKSLFGSWPR